MDTNKIAKLLRANTVVLRDQNMDVVDAVITPNRLIRDLADYFESEGNPCDCDGKRTQYPCIDACPSLEPWDRAKFVRCATGG